MGWVTEDIGVAGRYWKRTFSEPVARSIAKTIAEPVTNSWDSYKRIGDLPSTSGIVDALMALKEGDRVDQDKIVGSGHIEKRARIKVIVAAECGSPAFRLDVVGNPP